MFLLPSPSVVLKNGLNWSDFSNAASRNDVSENVELEFVPSAKIDSASSINDNQKSVKSKPSDVSGFSGYLSSFSEDFDMFHKKKDGSNETQGLTNALHSPNALSREASRKQPLTPPLSSNTEESKDPLATVNNLYSEEEEEDWIEDTYGAAAWSDSDVSGDEITLILGNKKPSVYLAETKKKTKKTAKNKKLMHSKNPRFDTLGNKLFNHAADKAVVLYSPLENPSTIRAVRSYSDTTPTFTCYLFFSKYQGKLLLLFSALVYSFVAVFVKLAYRKLPWLVVVVCQSWSYFIYASVHNFCFLGFNPMGKETQPIRGLLVLRGFVGSVSFLLYYTGLKILALGDATAIYFTSPIFTAFFSHIFTNDAFQYIHAVCGFVGVVGVCLIAKPEFFFGAGTNELNVSMEEGGASWLVTLAYSGTLFGAMLGGLNLILIRKIAKQTLPSVGSYYFGVTATCATTTILLTYLSTGHTLDLRGVPWFYWLCAILVGLFSFLGQLSVSKALQTETAFSASMFRNFDICMAYVSQVIIFHDSLDILACIGGILISCAVCTILVSKNESSS